MFEGFVFHEVAHQIEDGAVEDFLALLDGLVAQGLGQMRFADARRAEQQNIFALAEVSAGGQFEDLFAVDRRVELPVEVFEGLKGTEVGGFGAASQHSLVAHVEFVLQDQFEELAVAQAGGGGFLQAHAQALEQAGEAQLTEGGIELAHGVGGELRFCVGSMR